MPFFHRRLLMKQKTLVALSGLALVWSFQVLAVTDVQYQAIRWLGKLNGTALPCHYLEQTRRMKQAMVTTLPKRRALGDAFDQATNEAFLEFTRQRRSCPPLAEFTRQVNEGIDMLRMAFPSQQPTTIILEESDAGLKTIGGKQQ